MAATLAGNGILFRGEGMLFAADGAGGEDVFQTLGQTAMAIVNIRTLLQPLKFVVEKPLPDTLGQLRQGKFFNLLGGVKNIQFRFHKGTATEAFTPFGIGQIITVDLDGVDGNAGSLDEGIGAVLNILKPSGSGKPGFRHHCQNLPVFQDGEAVFGIFHVHGKHALGECTQPPQNAAQKVMVEVESGNNKMGLLLAQQCFGIDKVDKRSVIAKDNGRTFRLADFVDGLDPDTAEEQIKPHQNI